MLLSETEKFRTAWYRSCSSHNYYNVVSKCRKTGSSRLKSLIVEEKITKFKFNWNLQLNDNVYCFFINIYYIHETRFGTRLGRFFR